MGLALRLKVPKMFKDVGELTPSPRVVRVPRLCDTGVGSPKLPDEGGDPDEICNHVKGVPLFHYLLCKKWPNLSSVSRTTSVAQWRYQLNLNCAPLGHSFRTSHNMAVRFSSLNALRASMRRNPQSSSWACSYQRTRIA